MTEKNESTGEKLASESELAQPIALTTIHPTNDPEVVSFYNQALKLEAYAKQRVIATIEDLKPATDDLAIIAGVLKGMEGKRKEYLQPFQNHIKETNEAYKALMSPIYEADHITRTKMLAFDKEQRHIRQEQEEINRKRTEAAEAEMRLKGEVTEPTQLVEVSPEAPKATRTAVGTAGMVDVWKWKVEDFSAVPDAYKVIDNSQLTAIARRHHDQKPIPGVRFYNEPTISVRTK